MTPTIGRIVHCQAHGSPDGTHRSVPRAVLALVGYLVRGRLFGSRQVIFLALISQLALGADPVDAGTGPVAVAVESATLRPLDAPTAPLEVGPGVYLPEALAVDVAGKVAAYEAAKASPPTTSAVAWLVVGALVVAAGGGFALGWAARPVAAQ